MTEVEKRPTFALAYCRNDIAKAMNLPTPVPDIVEAFLEAIDAEVPALVEGLYLVGSVALSDFRPPRSDIDFIAVTANQPDAACLVALERVHTRLQERWQRPFFDGIYVTWHDLADDPARAGSGPYSHEGLFHADGWGERNPITWHTLAQSGVRCRGPAIADINLWSDSTVLTAWTNDNLDAYWRRLLDRGARLLTPSGIAGLTSYACEWCVLGVSRLHYTLSTGKITSKEGAGIYARETFPVRWHRLIEEALRIRRATERRSLYRSPFARRRDVLTFTDVVITDAHRRYKQSE